MSNERYELRCMPLARGVMGEVWQGRDRRTGREVAAKFPRVPVGADRHDMWRRFSEETRITASLLHPGLPTVLATGVAGGRPYLVMRRIPGSTVSDRIAAHGRLPVRTAAAIAARACAALAAVHDAGLVHRDVAPANLMLGPDGAVTLIDLGLAVPAGTRGDWPRGVHGTPAYRCPEDFLGRPSGPRGDLYALGCTLHEMLTGRRPGCARNGHPVEETMRLPTEMTITLRALLARDPADRPASARDVRAVLLRCASEPHAADPPLTLLPQAV